MRERAVPTNAPAAPADTRFQPGNTRGLVTGERSPRTGPELYPERADALLQREQEILADLGGEAQVSTTRRELVTRFIQASAIADALAEDFITFGVLTGKGRARRSVATWLSVLDRIQRLASTIGLERQAKPVDLARALSQPRGDR